MQAYMYDGVGPDDPRNKQIEGLSSCMLGHLDMISKFYYESDKEFGIMCEDDICIHDEFAKNLPSIVEAAKYRDIDLILLGYLMNYHIDYNGSYGNHHIAELESNTNHHFYTYTEHMWGTQMFMVSKSYAKYIVETFTLDYCEKNKHIEPFAADWILTKKTNKRALIYPPFCIENGDVSKFIYDHQASQIELHRLAYELHVNPHFI
jgi:GR25 family glycosyltransferase involved in LPS biosynthesis